MRLTDEQQEIVASEADRLVVNAFAGTGKTSTLVEYVRARPRQRFLNVVFNKSVQVEASTRFPTGNTQSKTYHGLAFPQFGRLYTHKLGSDLKPHQIVEFLGVKQKIEPALANLFGARVRQTLINYLSSADPEMTVHHADLPRSPAEQKLYDADALVRATSKLWQRMQDTRDAVPMLHDGYLKLYQLSQPRLKYDVILLDEAQDLSRTVWGIMQDQDARKILVGDRHQGIYGSFRNAVNAMDLVRQAEQYHLTRSFRFGPEVARVANALLALKGETVPLQGAKPGDSIGPVDRRFPYAFITRGNAALFNEAVDAVRKGRSIGFIGGVDGYRLDKILDVHRMRTGQRARDPFFASFEHFDALQEFATQTEDREVISLCNIVTRYPTGLPDLVARIRAAAVEDYKTAHVILGTAHKFKGLESPAVILGPDYLSLHDDTGGLLPANMLEAEELNILYVAATRAERRLCVTDDLQQYLAQVGRVAAPRARPY